MKLIFSMFVLLFTLVPSLLSSQPYQVAPTVTPIVTPDPYRELTIDTLTNRSYGGGVIAQQEILTSTNSFIRYLIVYPSDGLNIYGFINIPKGSGRFPVIIATHGYVNPAIYRTLDYTTRYADALARAGYIVVHPNLRGYKPSDNGPNEFRVGFAVDILNLIAIVRQQAGNPGLLEDAIPDSIGVWGHSMGGGVSIRVITISPDIRAAVLYGSMSGDELRNYAKILEWSNGTSGKTEIETPADALFRLSPIYHLNRIQTAVSIHHGEKDETVPLEWSMELCQHLQMLDKVVECFSYANQPHVFQGNADQLFIQRSIVFFDTYLKNH